ncbi:LEM domain-containing protein 1 [Orycteropus afer afer]|uniref:LEM domain-containing protein 1 n=1 Tax=Orycteropus afer afer TaxID=1230840 RepID=A0A8B7AWY7_ORYAF|nr:LEM domain-containing protein 1 [Orycteropus afer afer]
MVDVKCLSDCELQGELKKLGFSPGPILPSTRKVYENKLVQLLVSSPCVSPMMNGLGELDEPQESDNSEEFNTTIVLKGNITLSTEKGKGPRKRPETATTKPKALDCYCLDYNTSKEIRSAVVRISNTRIREESITKEKDCFKSQELEELPVAVTFAVLSIFIIVVFIYITMERKPLFG